MRLINARRAITACALSAAAVAAVAGPSTASAATQCSGSNIQAKGSSFQNSAQQVWKADFNTSKNAKACSGSLKPTVTYLSGGSGAGLETWGVNKHAFEMGTYAYFGTDEPVDAAQKAEIEANETTLTPETVQTIPVAQGAIIIGVHLPTGCTATNPASPGRISLTDAELNAVFTGEDKTWASLASNGNVFTGTCTTAIQPIVRADQSGTTHILKKYLALISSTKFETETGSSANWLEISEGTENTNWPKAAGVKKPAKTGGGAEISEVAAVPSSIGYVDLATGRANATFQSSGGAGTSLFWAEVQDNGPSVKAPKYADPSTNGESNTSARANCASTKYTNGKGTRFPPATTALEWNEVTTALKEKNYPICGLTYDTLASKYSAYPGTSEGEAVTANNYLLWILETKAEGGQPIINENHDYEALPKALVKEAAKGAALAAF